MKYWKWRMGRFAWYDYHGDWAPSWLRDEHGRWVRKFWKLYYLKTKT